MIGRILRNSSVYGLGELAARLTVFALVPVYTIYLEPEQLALWGLGAMGLQLLTTSYGLGLQAAVLQGQYDYPDDPQGLRRYNGTIATFLLFWPLLFHVGLEFVGPGLLTRFLPQLPWAPYGRMLSLTALLSTAAIVPIAAWTAGEKPRAFVVLNTSKALLETGLTFAMLVAAGAGVLSIFAGRLAGAGLVAVPLLLISFRRVSPGIRWSLLGPTLAFSLPLLPHLLSTWALTMADRVLLSWLVGDRPLGIYTAAYWFPIAVNVLAMSGYRAWSPRFHKSIDLPEERPALTRATTSFAVAVVVASLGAAAVAPDLVLALFDPRYHEGAPLARVLVLGAAFQGLYYVAVAPLYNRKRKLAIPLGSLVAASTNIVLNLLWIPDHGALGAAWATLLSYGVLVGVVGVAARRQMALPLHWGALAGATVVMVVTLLVGDALPLEAGWLSFGVRAVLAALGAGVALKIVMDRTR